MTPPTATANVKQCITLLGPTRMNDMNRGSRPAQQLSYLRCCATQSGANQNTLNALVLGVTAGAL